MRLDSSRAVVSHLPETEPLGRGDGPGRVAVTGPQDRKHVAGAALAQAGVDERADDRAHHLPAERGGADVVAEDAVAEVVPRGLGDAPDRGGALGTLAAERREVVLPHE